MNRHALPAPIDGDYDIPMPEDDEPITSDFGRLEPPCHVVTMEEQRRIAADVAFAKCKARGGALRLQIDQAHVREIDAGLHNLHEPFEGLIR